MDGYMSDRGEAFRLSGYSFDQHPPPPHRLMSSGTTGNEDGYLSEGGASLYARKIQTRIAIEKQKVTTQAFGSPVHLIL